MQETHPSKTRARNGELFLAEFSLALELCQASFLRKQVIFARRHVDSLS